MTIFEKIKNMNQDEAIEYIRNGLCKLYKLCDDCPIYSYNLDDCTSEFLINFLEIEVQD